jgi:hypothetical protein
VLLAIAVPYGFHEAREYYGPSVDGARRLPTLEPGVKVVIMVFVGSTLALIGWWVRLLWRPGKGTLSRPAGR